LDQNHNEEPRSNKTERENYQNDERMTIDEVPNQTFLEETSAEFTHPISEDEQSNEVHHVYGWIGLALSIISFFFIPFLFSIAGIIVGIIARNRRSTALGYSAIIVGALSFIFNLFMIPFM